MIRLTKAQQISLKRIYDRHEVGRREKMTYREFRKTVHPFISGLCMQSDCVMVNCAGMWIGIETDGYSHT